MTTQQELRALVSEYRQLARHTGADNARMCVMDELDTRLRGTELARQDGVLRAVLRGIAASESRQTLEG